MSFARALVLLLLPAACGWADTLPFAAHNAYPADKQERALRLEYPAIEVDITYDGKRKAAVVTHDRQPSGEEPELSEFLEPIWADWARVEGRVLIIDSKTSDPRVGEAIEAALAPQANVLSQMGPGGVFREGNVTVCISGSRAAKDAYRKVALRAGRYLAFCDAVHGTGVWQEDPADYVPRQAPGYCRFISMDVLNFMKSETSSSRLKRGLDEARDWLIGLIGKRDANDTFDPARLGRMMDAARDSGYIVRIWTIGPLAGYGQPRLGLWKAMADAGVHFIATDDYEDAARWWKTQGHATRFAAK